MKKQIDKLDLINIKTSALPKTLLKEVKYKALSRRKPL